MKERMSQITKGIISKELPVFTVTPDRISRKMEAGKSISCDLMIRTRGEVPVKGLVFSSDPHIIISANGFSGYVCRILMEIKTGIGESGRIVKGHLTIVTEAGEMQIPYDIEIVSGGGMGETLPETIEEFANMAQENWKKATELFVSAPFLRCAFFQHMELLCLYQGLIKGNNAFYAMEEFLTALGMKNAAIIEAENITEEQQGKITKVHFLLKQKEWGYAQIALNTRKDICGKESFLQVHKKWDTFDLIESFPKGKMEGVVEIPIEESLIHAGVNEAIIEINNGKRTVVHKIRIKSGNGCTLEHKQQQKDKKEMIQALTAVFAQKYAAKKKTGDAWRNHNAARNLTELSAAFWERYPQCWNLPLIQVAAWMEAGERERALTLLQQISASIFSRRYEEPQCYALYLYLEEALKGNDIDDSACQSLREIYKRKKDVFVFYYLTEVDVQWIAKPTRILQELEYYFQHGIHSAFLYGKACQILQSIPDFIAINSAFQRQALYFGVNYDLLTLDTMVHMSAQVLVQENPHWFLYHILSHMYGRTQNKIVLQALIHVLLQHRKQEKKYFSWYELGMKENFSEQGLARYYLITAPEASYEPFLKQILLYYSYEDNLDPILQEKLYTNVYQFYQSDKRIFSLYSSRIEKLMAERMIQKKIDHNLAYLYRCMIHPDMIDRKMAGELPELLHMKQVVGLSPSTQFLILRYPELDIEIQVPCVESTQDQEKMANIPVHSERAFFFQEDEEGKRSAIFNLQLRQWIHREDLEQICREQNPEQFSLQLEFLQLVSKQGLKKEQDASRLLALAEMLPISAPFVDKIVREIVDFCREHPEYEEGDGILLGLDISTLEKARQKHVIDMLVEKGFIGRAQDNIQKIGWNSFSIKSKLAYFKLWKSSVSNLSADNKMLALCQSIMEERVSAREKDLSLQDVLEYLCAFYSGSQRNMIVILQKAIEEKCNLYHMPERLLVQSIFSGKWEVLDQILEWYLQYEEAKPLPVRAAYVILSYQYFILKKKSLEHWMEKSFLKQIFGKNPPIISVLARLSFLSEQEVWEDDWKKEAQEFLAELLEKEQYFGFYHGLCRHIPMPVWLEGRIILEYRGKEAIRPVLEYERSGWDMEKISVRMEEVYPGIYTQQILLFSDEQLLYRIYEEGDGYQKELCAVSQCQEKPFETEYSHFSTLNHIARYLGKEECAMVKQEIKRMEEEVWLIQALFPIRED